VDSASGLVKMGRGAVGERLEPKGGLQTYFEPHGPSLKDISCLSGKPAKATPTAEPIFTSPAAYTCLTRISRWHQRLLFVFLLG